jgi:hypothetical protein
MRKWTSKRVPELRRQHLGLSHTVFELPGLSFETIRGIEGGRAVTRTQSLALSYTELEVANA